MVLTWPRTVTCEPRGSDLRGVGHDLVDLRGDEAEVVPSTAP